MYLLRSNRRSKSKRWIYTVGGVIAVTVIGSIVGIVIWQTQKGDGTGPEPEIYPGEFSSAAVSCDAPYCAEIGK